jgi:hypothetical protein
MFDAALLESGFNPSATAIWRCCECGGYGSHNPLCINAGTTGEPPSPLYPNGRDFRRQEKMVDAVQVIRVPIYTEDPKTTDAMLTAQYKAGWTLVTVYRSRDLSDPSDANKESNCFVFQKKG